MPIHLENGEYTFRCINWLLSSHMGPGGPLETMESESPYLTLVGVEPKLPPGPGVPIAVTLKPRLNLHRGLAVRAYTCSVCGYVELYEAALVEPEKWGDG